MEPIQEVAVTSCLNDSVVSVHMWDVQTGSSLMTYRGDIPVGASALSVLSGQYVLAALQDKPFLRVWPVNSQQPLSSLRLVCPGRVSLAQASPDGCYIAVTVSEKLHIFQVASGRLVGTGVRHYQRIRVCRWTKDSSFVVCGGEDGLVTIWSLSILTNPQSTPEPKYVLSDHTLPVTDLTVTAGSRTRLYSVSADRTCKIYDLHQGNLLVSVVFDKVLTAVAVSALETEVFVGTDSGTILQLSLLSPPRHLEYHVSPEENAPVFEGHTKAIQSLSTSVNGDLLMSGSADGSVKMWHISSRQCLRSKFTHKGPVTNAFFASKPKQLFDNELKPSIVINSFQTSSTEEKDFVEVITRQSLVLCDNSVPDLFPPQVTSSSEDRLKSLQMEIDLLRSINSNLYKFSVDKVIAGNILMPRPTEVSVKAVKKRLKKAKTVFKESVSKNKPNNVNLPVNGLKKKKKKKRNKKKQSVE